MTSEIPRWRVVLLAFLCIFAMLAIVGHLLMIGIEAGKRPGVPDLLRETHIPAYRGQILDRNGWPLAITGPGTLLAVHPDALQSEDLRALLGDMGKFRQLAPVDFDVAGKIRLLQLSGVELQGTRRRYYPAGAVSAHVIGFLDEDSSGRAGIEAIFDDTLRGRSGVQVVPDREGGMPLIQDVRLPEDGDDLRLTLDIGLQQLAYRSLQKAVRDVKGQGGSLILVAPATGEILALVSQPSFDPNVLGVLKTAAVPARGIAGYLAFTAAATPVIVAAALQSGRYFSRSTVDVSPGVIRVQGEMIRDLEDHGVIDIGTLVAKSSRVGLARLAQNLDTDHLLQLLQDVGIGSPSDIGFPAELPGSLPEKASIQGPGKARLINGHGCYLTPLQLARIYSIFANRGLSVPLSVVQQDRDRSAPKRVMPASVAAAVLAMLGAPPFTRESSGSWASVYRISGEMGVASGFTPGSTTLYAAAVAPASDPRIVAVMTLDEPAEYVSDAPIKIATFTEILAIALRFLKAPPDKLVERHAGALL